jgi:hypothetical protein
MRLWTFIRVTSMTKVSSQHGERRCWCKRYWSGVASGYLYHLQLIRFRSHPEPIQAAGAFLAGLAEEAGRRSYDFDVTKILEPGVVKQIEETESQLLYELAHLREKLHRGCRIFTGSFGAIIIPNLTHYYSASSLVEPESGRNDDPRSQAVILLSIALKRITVNYLSIGKGPIQKINLYTTATAPGRRRTQRRHRTGFGATSRC